MGKEIEALERLKIRYEQLASSVDRDLRFHSNKAESLKDQAGMVGICLTELNAEIAKLKDKL